MEPIRDRELEAALRRLEGDASLDDAGLNRLGAAIAARAQGSLSALRRAPAWWDYAASWARTAVPLAAAAGVVAAALLSGGPSGDGPAIARGVVGREGLALWIAGEARAGEVVDAFVGPTDERWLLDEMTGGADL